MTPRSRYEAVSRNDDTGLYSFHVTVYKPGNYIGHIEEFEFLDEASLKKWLRQQYSDSKKFLEDVRNKYLLIHLGRKVEPFIDKVAEFGVRWW